MSSQRIKNKSQNLKLLGSSSSKSTCSSEQYPWISFRYMSTNKNYNLQNLTEGRDREATLLGLYNRLEDISSHSWAYWLGQAKRCGLETLSAGDLNFKAKPEANLTSDVTVYVFRFDTYRGSNKGRIIGYKSSPCSAFHIIGYDLDFSAYNHGK